MDFVTESPAAWLSLFAAVPLHDQCLVSKLGCDAVRAAIRTGSLGLAKGILEGLQQKCSYASAAYSMRVVLETFREANDLGSTTVLQCQNPAFTSIAVEAFWLMVDSETNQEVVEKDFNLLVSCGIDLHGSANGILQRLQHGKSRKSAKHCLRLVFKALGETNDRHSTQSSRSQKLEFASIAVDAFLLMLKFERPEILVHDLQLLVSCEIAIDFDSLAKGIFEGLIMDHNVRLSAAHCMRTVLQLLRKANCLVSASYFWRAFSSIAVKAVLRMFEADLLSTEEFKSALECLSSSGADHAIMVKTVLQSNPVIHGVPVIQTKRAWQFNRYARTRFVSALLLGDKQALVAILSHTSMSNFFAKDSLEILAEHIGQSPSLWSCAISSLLEAKRDAYVEELLCALAQQPYLGMSSHFVSLDKDHLTQGIQAALPLYLEMKDSCLHCGCLRMLHCRLRFPAGVWLKIVDFVGLYNAACRTQTVARACVGDYIENDKAKEQKNTAKACEPTQPKIIDEINHQEPAAVISPEEAAVTANELCFSLIQHNLNLLPSSIDVDQDVVLSFADVERTIGDVNNNDANHMVDTTAENDTMDSVEEWHSLGFPKRHQNQETQSLDGESQKNKEDAVSRDDISAVGSSPTLADSMGQNSGLHDITRYPTILLLNFSRHPKTFEEAVCNGEELRECRELLESAGYANKLPCGTKVFVSPAEYKLSINALKGRKLGPSYVVVSEALEHMLFSAINGLPHKDKVREKNREVVAQGEFAVERTFLSCVRPCSEDHVTVSSTQVRRGSCNPRQAAVDIDFEY